MTNREFELLSWLGMPVYADNCVCDRDDSENNILEKYQMESLPWKDPYLILQREDGFYF